MYRNVARKGSVLVVGLGALGCPASMALAGAPLERLTLVDPDRVEPSNLQRQILFGADDVGALKVDVATERLRRTGLRIDTLGVRLDASNAAALIADHDFTLDCCDDPPTKFLINTVAVEVGRSFSYGGVTRTAGLALSVVPDETACLACVFTDAPMTDLGDARANAPGGCQDQGIVAPVAGVVGSLQALQALGALGHADAGAPGRLFAYEVRGTRWHIIDTRRDPGCNVCGRQREAHHQRRMESWRS